MKKLFKSFKIYAIFTVLLGLIYPLLVTLIAQVLMPYKANGSLVRKGDTVIGSRLIAQNFTGAQYFHPRFSANNYDGTNSGATNLGPSSKKLMDDTADKINKARQENNLSPDALIPADMVLSSASGLDPHISLDNALLQAGRISKIRGIPLADLKKMITESTDSDFIGIWGDAGVNVLKLNLALDGYGKNLK